MNFKMKLAVAALALVSTQVFADATLAPVVSQDLATAPVSADIYVNNILPLYTGAPALTNVDYPEALIFQEGVNGIAYIDQDSAAGGGNFAAIFQTSTVAAGAFAAIVQGATATGNLGLIIQR